ncbi:DEAD/DEAH box helicase [Alginatibacterium sediminis]|uniref:DEAD/DEAH box helicase n=1 Tax=Alginatibacterium sediminis TaxID=2164068 RepID=A0A420EH17_9ALTE|nr:DEAD/DEAH box helicase [Alginatibacterium sediminis]RKF19973.1 DEAD/DEAH box helicase [Alginatibacterium sediminis]
MSFGSFSLCKELQQSLIEQGYTKATAIQQQAIPLVLEQRDLIAIAQTGTGKTASFSLPMLQLLTKGTAATDNHIRALVLTPTRELAAQVGQAILSYSSLTNLSTTAVHGGVRIEPQIAKLQSGVDVLVATPGRLLDLYTQQALSFDKLEILVLDEADRMLDLGFVDDIRHIQKLLPIKRQNLMFSATFTNPIRLLAEDMLNSPATVEISPETSNLEAISQRVHPVDKNRKTELLIHLIKSNSWNQVLIFCRTKHGADNLVTNLEQVGIRGASIHANRTQHARTQVLGGFRDGSIKVLVATDLASRGIDLSRLSCVINLDLPFVAEDYVHRIGRTGRAGHKGLAISLFSDDESKQLKSIEKLIGRTFTQTLVPGFELAIKPIVDESDDDLYGNFEPDPTYLKQTQKRSKHTKSGSNRSRSKRR